MKYSTRTAALFLAAVLLLQAGGLLPARAEEKVRYYSGWAYIIKDGEITLQWHTSGGTGLMVPAGIKGYPVTALGEGALENDTVLKYITLPESIRSIGRWAFMGCTSLTKVTFKEKSKLESIGDAAFMGCISLAKVTLPKSLKTLGLFVFSGCTSLSDIPVEQQSRSFKSRDGVLFSYDGAALHAFPPARKGGYAVPEGVRVIKGGAFGGSMLSSVQLPSTLEAIDAFAFSNCKALTAAALPEGLLEIGMQAFSGCSALERLVIPASVLAIGEGAFMGCTRMMDLQVAAGSQQYKIRDSMLVTADGADLVAFTPGLKGQATVPDGVVTVRMFAFAGCKGLTMVTLPEGCLSIGVCAFMDCVNLESIILPDSLREIRMQAFSNCSTLAKVILPAGLDRVEANAFMDCKQLRALALLGSDTVLDKGMLTAGSKVELYGYKESTAAKYAKAYDFDFTSLPEPTPVPTEVPTPVPTEVPTPVPTEVPTLVPTEVPTPVPTEVPTVPAVVPTDVPTAEPTAVVTEEPTAVTKAEITASPSPIPTVTLSPSPAPTPTASPSPSPTASPPPTPTASPSPSPTASPSPSPTFTGPGKLSVIQEVFRVYPYSDYYYGEIYAQVQNTGGKPVAFNGGLLELYGPAEDVIVSRDFNECYPRVLASGEIGYAITSVSVQTAKAPGDIADYSLAITSHGNINVDVVRYPVRAVYSESRDGSYTYDNILLTIENNTDAPASNISIVFALTDADGTLLYAKGYQIYNITLSPHSTMEYRDAADRAFSTWRVERGIIPAAVWATAYAMTER